MTHRFSDGDLSSFREGGFAQGRPVATAAAAYRAAERIECDREGRVHDYTRKQSVEHAEIIVPSEASWARDRSVLWNAAEAAEKRINSTVAREYELALPAELPASERIGLARNSRRPFPTVMG